ncbi:pseudouridine-5'-phosphatase-like [Argiope bruennichi]|uniref:pseudouridine 5'-phosphatase n=1 Tax=Argiope bruennichi TaxID=94029 RepID=A0A8T0EQ35_ARGBR|nr:pseudouridine-5'-phosphatase-like [Argiope bruennichi]KAF8778003.1 Pseudouridine-5'-phosphatase like protein [Argiope bruennichi]
MATYKPVTHVIFDMDGLIFDTERIYTEIHQTIASKYGKVFTWEVKVKCMGKVADEAARTFIKELELPITVEEYHATFAEICKEMFQKTQVLPGVERLIKHLHATGVPIAIATSSKKETMDMKTKNHRELISLFHHVVCGSNDPEVKRGKPAPDVFLVCASRFEDKPSPDQVLVFEDAPNGVEAALAAGMQVVMVPDERLQPEFYGGATLVLKSMEDFKPELFGLPPFPQA